MANYIYSISNDIPGGVFTSNASTILVLLCRDFITDNPLTNVGTVGDVLTISFQNPLSPADKTTLDNNTTGPSGGLLARCPADFEIIFQPGAHVETTAQQALEPYPVTENQVVNPFINQPTILFIDPNGIDVSTITLQYLDGYGNPASGFSNGIEFVSQAYLPLNTDAGNFDGFGQASFIVGPSFDYGVVPIFIFAQYLPFKGFQLRVSLQD